LQARLKFTSNISFQKLYDKLPEILEKGGRRITRSSAKGAKDRIDKGLSPPLKRSTIELRKEKGTGGTKPLYETGSLYRSIKSTDEGLEMKKYGWYHHKGFTVKNVPVGFENGKPVFHKSKKISKKVPARPFIFPSKKEILEPMKKIYMDVRKSLSKRKVIE